MRLPLIVAALAVLLALLPGVFGQSAHLRYAADETAAFFAGSVVSREWYK
jgi:hypothetical protein